MALTQGEAIAVSNFDTGTFTVTMNSNMTSGSHFGKYMGPLCIVMIDKIYTGSDSSAVSIGSVPAGFRPVSIVGNGNFSRSYSAMSHIEISTDGNIRALGVHQNDVIHGVVIYFRY